jgi:hypothetical protein
MVNLAHELRKTLTLLDGAFEAQAKFYDKASKVMGHNM